MTAVGASAPPARSWRSQFSPTVARLAALIALVAVFTVVSPFFLTTGNLVNVMQNAVVVGLVAAPLTLLLVARQVDLSVGSAVAFAATCFTLVSRDVGLPVAIPVAFAAAMLVAVINAFAITRLRVNSVIATLGTLLAFRGLTKILGAGSNIPVTGFELIGRERISILGLEVPISVFILAAILVVFWAIMSWSRYGRHMTAMGANPTASRLAGIDLARNVVKGFLLTGLVVGLTSLIVVSSLGATSPTTAQGLEFLALTAVILGGASLSGGRGTILGTTIAVLILAVLDNGLTLARVSSFWQEVVRGGLLIGAVALDQLRIARRRVDGGFEL
jgi:ribose/xylose/arabinose/galactoside ABC-type transport system permease subunit